GGTDGEVVGRGCADGDRAAGARDGRISGIGGGQRLVAGRLQRGRERADTADQGTVGRQSGLAVGAAEVDGAGVGRGRVVEGVQGRHREAEACPRDGRGRCADGEVRGGCRADGDGGAGAGDAAGAGVGGGQRLIPGGLEGGAEGANPAG